MRMVMHIGGVRRASQPALLQYDFAAISERRILSRVGCEVLRRLLPPRLLLIASERIHAHLTFSWQTKAGKFVWKNQVLQRPHCMKFDLLHRFRRVLDKRCGIGHRVSHEP